MLYRAKEELLLSVAVQDVGISVHLQPADCSAWLLICQKVFTIPYCRGDIRKGFFFVASFSEHLNHQDKNLWFEKELDPFKLSKSFDLRL